MYVRVGAAWYGRYSTIEYNNMEYNIEYHITGQLYKLENRYRLVFAFFLLHVMGIIHNP